MNFVKNYLESRFPTYGEKNVLLFYLVTIFGNSLASVAWLTTGLVSSSLILGVFVFTFITATGTLSELWSSVILNKHVLSKDRATAISTLSFLVQIPYVLVVILFGSLVADNAVAPFYIVTGTLLMVGLISFVYAERSKVLVRKSPTL